MSIVKSLKRKSKIKISPNLIQNQPEVIVVCTVKSIISECPRSSRHRHVTTELCFTLLIFYSISHSRPSINVSITQVQTFASRTNVPRVLLFILWIQCL